MAMIQTQKYIPDHTQKGPQENEETDEGAFYSTRMVVTSQDGRKHMEQDPPQTMQGQYIEEALYQCQHQMSPGGRKRTISVDNLLVLSHLTFYSWQKHLVLGCSLSI